MLLQKATQLTEAANEIMSLLRVEKIEEIVSRIPEDWLIDASDSLSPDEMRMAYIEFIIGRLEKIDLLVKEAEDER